MINTEEHRLSLKQSGLEMLLLCKSQLEKSREAFVNYDGDLAEEVIYTETRVNALDLKIEKDCERFLALYNPVAKDLRFAISILKINYNLERLADHACNISKYVVDENNKVSIDLISKLEIDKMYDNIESMMDNIATAYDDKDVKEVRKVFKKDKTLDQINKKSFQVVEAEIKKDDAILQQCLIGVSVVKKLERVGDLIKNIAEEIIFYVDAEVLKHKKKKKKE